jgi:hypothetical protein
MLLVEDNHRIETLSPDAPIEALDVRILPQTLRCDHDFFEAHMLDALPKGRAADTVAIAQQIAWHLVPRERLDHLLRRPLSGRMLGNVEVHHASALMGEDHEDKEDQEHHRRHHEKVEATRFCTWFVRKVFHVGDRGFRGCTRYFSTVDFATAMPSFRSSPTMRGDPQVGLACHILRMTSRTSLAMVGRPGIPY